MTENYKRIVTTQNLILADAALLKLKHYFINQTPNTNQLRDVTYEPINHIKQHNS
jgi:hypothetical protein